MPPPGSGLEGDRTNTNTIGATYTHTTSGGMARRWCIYIAHRWRLRKTVLGLMAFETALTVACLALFGIADPNTYRTKLWQNGADQGFNSDPSSILYDYANYRPVHVPLVWSQLCVYSPPPSTYKHKEGIGQLANTTPAPA